MSNQTDPDEFKSVAASRQGVIPLIGVYGGPGVGKTMSSLLIARGFVGPEASMRLIDTETRRGEFYADVIPGGFRAVRFNPPFSPSRYMQALKAQIAEGAKIIVIDSMSHCWEGEGGVCDMAGQNEQDSGKSGLHNWRRPKIEHQMMLQFMLRSPIPIVFCMRAKQKTRQTLDEKGKKVIRKDDYYSPIQEGDFAYELTAAIEILPDHTLSINKCSHPGLRKIFEQSGPITTKHGELLRQWCESAGQPIKPDAKALKVRLWTATKDIHGGDKDKLAIWLREHGLLAEGVSLDSLNDSELENICNRVEKFA